MIDVSGDSLYGLWGKGKLFDFRQISYNFPQEERVVLSIATLVVEWFWNAQSLLGHHQ